MSASFRSFISYLLIVACCITTELGAQIYQDYFGNGHTVGVKVSSSNDHLSDSAFHSIDGSILLLDTVGAARFLSNATLGANYEMIKYVNQIGVKPWIDEQMSVPPYSYLETYRAIYDHIVSEQSVVPNLIVADSIPFQEYMGFAFYEHLFTKPDVLRQRVAFALSQIFVITRTASFILNRGFGISDYYDVLYQGAFGNFRDLLEEVTLHPIMGVYLSHLKNKKADITAGVFPDENFAREIMQLFTIGLFELNMDGTLKLDAHGNATPTYDIKDVEELAKVFTGLSGGAYDPQSVFYQQNRSLIFNAPFNQFDYTVPMIMYNEFHDSGIKILVTGDTLPAGQSGVKDISDVLDMLFHHPNTAPFIAKRLIQHMVKSNPSPAYVQRISLVFEDNGAGVRGDMAAIIKALLTDPEAINCEWIGDTNNGKLIQPLERFINLFLAFDLKTPSGKYYFRDINVFQDQLEQSFLNAPSVFNFFSPFFAESNFVEPADLVSPEFQIFHAISSINYLNILESSLKRHPFHNFTSIHPDIGILQANTADVPILDFDDELLIYQTQGIQALLNRLNLILCRGQLSQQTMDIISYTINQYQSTISSYTSRNALNDAIYFVMASPDYIIQK